jgi:FAD synthetase
VGGSTARKTRSSASGSKANKRKAPVRVFVGGTFDGLHSGHLYLLEFARAQGAKLARRTGRPGVRLSAVVARDESVLRIKHRAPHHNQEERQRLLAGLRAVDEAIVGVPNDFIRSVRRVDPDLIVLGYDQKPNWEDALREAGIEARIVRCPAYASRRLKSSKLRDDLVAMAT